MMIYGYKHGYILQISIHVFFCSNDSNGETTDGQQFTELLMDCPEPKKWMCFVFDGFCMFFLLIQK